MFDHLLSPDLQKVAKLGRDGKLQEFWFAYAKYLHDKNIISPSRQLLYDMALATARKLKEIDNG